MKILHDRGRRDVTHQLAQHDWPVTCDLTYICDEEDDNDEANRWGEDTRADWLVSRAPACRLAFITDNWLMGSGSDQQANYVIYCW